jgi:ribose/xylose/arabinose/galactoside ABC-type transport system permease subunit
LDNAANLCGRAPSCVPFVWRDRGQDHGGIELSNGAVMSAGRHGHGWVMVNMNMPYLTWPSSYPCWWASFSASLNGILVTFMGIPSFVAHAG